MSPTYAYTQKGLTPAFPAFSKPTFPFRAKKAKPIREPMSRPEPMSFDLNKPSYDIDILGLMTQTQCHLTWTDWS